MLIDFVFCLMICYISYIFIYAIIVDEHDDIGNAQTLLFIKVPSKNMLLNKININ